MQSKTLNITINCAPKKVYEFVSNPEKMPEWAKAFCLAVTKQNGEWVMKTPHGAAAIRFAPQNEYGILDHYVKVAPGVEVYVPMRVVPNEKGSEVIFTLFRMPQMTEEDFARDIEWVTRDLTSLKEVLEKQ